MQSGNITHQFNYQKWTMATAVGMLVLLGIAVGAALTVKGWLPFKNEGERNIPIYVAAEQRTAQPVTLNAGFSAIAKAVTPAVVTIETSAHVSPEPLPFFRDPFEDFFQWRWPDSDNEQNQRRRAPQTPRSRLLPRGLGSGVIVSPDGYILSNNHVVAGAEKVKVTLLDGRNFTAKIVGSDPPSDVAVLRIEGNNLPTIPLGDSQQIEVGDVVLAVGNPLNVGQTVTMGIISAKGRTTNASGSGSYEDFLQTDAAINRGNSGGALVNMRAELIGIPSQILSQTGGNIGIGFAIPSALARNVMEQLIRGGQVRRGKLGITVGELNADLAEQFNFKGTKGALVQDIETGQPADRAGVKAGDIIVEFQGQRVTDAAQLRNLVAQSAPGATVKFKVWRDNAERELVATLSEIAGNKSGGSASPETGAQALTGVEVENLTPELIRQLNLPLTTRGVMIRSVADDSNAADAGLQRGDVIEGVNRQSINDVTEFRATLPKAGKKNVLLRVRRADGARYVVVQGGA